MSKVSTKEHSAPFIPIRGVPVRSDVRRLDEEELKVDSQFNINSRRNLFDVEFEEIQMKEEARQDIPQTSGGSRVR